MKSCQYLLKRLSAAISDTSDMHLKMWLEDSLNDCRRCHVVVGSPKAAVRIYSERDMLEIPVEFSQQVHECFVDQAA